MDLLVSKRRLIHAEEIESVLTVLDRCVVGADMRETLEPHEP